MKKLLAIATLAALSTTAFADEQCKAVIEGTDNMTFNLQSITIDKAACPEYTVELKHVGALPAAAMGHNIVIAKTADVEGVSNDGIGAGLENNYVKPDDARVIAHTKIIGGGQTDAVTFKTDKLTAGGDYEFFCSFPGHHAIMKGKVEVK